MRNIKETKQSKMLHKYLLSLALALPPRKAVKDPADLPWRSPKEKGASLRWPSRQEEETKRRRRTEWRGNREEEEDN